MKQIMPSYVFKQRPELVKYINMYISVCKLFVAAKRSQNHLFSFPYDYYHIFMQPYLCNLDLDPTKQI